jgi:hypothetical protein
VKSQRRQCLKTNCAARQSLSFSVWETWLLIHLSASQGLVSTSEMETQYLDCRGVEQAFGMVHTQPMLSDAGSFFGMEGSALGGGPRQRPTWMTHQG